MMFKKGLVLELQDNLGLGVILDVLRQNKNTYKLTICMADGGIMIGKFTPGKGIFSSYIDYCVYDSVEIAKRLRDGVSSV